MDVVDYRSTLNLPKTAFPMKGNLPTLEPQIQRRWEEMDLYRLSLEKPAPNGRFILHDGPPYSNGDIHMGHALNKILKDLIVRYWSMQGYQAPFVPGWDNHGMPIENNVSKEFRQKKVVPTRLELRRRCREYAQQWIDTQREQFKRLGLRGDWSNPYLTMDHAFEAKVVDIFGELAEQGYIYRGLKPVHWCPNDETALAEAEVEYGSHTSPSIYVRFPLRRDPNGIFGDAPRERCYTIIWTTTPWTLPANLAVAVHPDEQYVVARMGDVYYLLAEALLKPTMEAIGITDMEVVSTHAGSDLAGLVFSHPFIDRDSVLLTATHVTMDAGTGVVHTAPGHGREDFELGQANGLPALCPVDEQGRFTDEAGEFAGMDLKQGNTAVLEVLRERGALLHESSLEHQYPHCWRCHQPTIFRATVQWFMRIDANDLRQRALMAIQGVEWIPEESINRINAMVANRPDWCLSRQRAWGVGIPVFYCTQCKHEILDRSAINAVRDLVLAEGSDAWFEKDASEILPEGFTCPKCGATEFTKETDILDVWFDSGSTCRAVAEARPDLGYPSDLYLEGSDQHRGWFNSSLMIGMGTRGMAPYRAVITHGMLLDAEGHAMHKSRGNAISPNQVIERYGADVLRLWVASTNYTEDVRLGDEILKRVTDVYRRLRNTLRYCLANLDGFDPVAHTVAYAEMPEIDRWVLHRLQEVVSSVTDAYGSYAFYRAYHEIHNFCAVDLSAFYLDVIKDRLYTSPADSLARRSAQTVLHELATALCTMLAPILVHTAEEAWGYLPAVEGRPESVHLAAFPVVNEAFRDEELAARWSRLLDVREQVMKTLEEARRSGAISQPLEAHVRLRATGEWLELLRRYEDELAAIFIVSRASVEEASSGEIEVAAEPATGLKCERCWLVREDVGTSHEHPTLCIRCVDAVDLQQGGTDGSTAGSAPIP
ncbi:MAG TPA: isoleucine--tRNA ligase [Armatimonadota bacterium]|jgi:isoleucyl-tRNA synthetase|nr:isoleucine--tRNA ligase [Armatimonadota bacterium]HPO73629.1 isoleucine--tRNA ligase [Armatimonadota bacterium]